MNIMLVSVTERTREIGIRKAVNVPGSAILPQFLVEAVTVSIIGGWLGTTLGGSGAAVAGHVLHPKGLLSWPVVALAVGFAFVIGVVFGVYPARQAVRLNPIDALRFEQPLAFAAAAKSTEPISAAGQPAATVWQQAGPMLRPSAGFGRLAGADRV